MDTPLVLIGIPLVVGLVLRALTAKRVGAVLGPLSRASRELTILGGGLALVEKSAFTAARLLELKSRIEQAGAPSSAVIARLNRHIGWIESRRNQIFAPIAFFLLWELQFAIIIERWRHRHGSRIRTWLGVIGEFEALLSLSTYAWEHPSDPFPVIAETPGRLDARDMAHPLRPMANFVTNSLAFEEGIRLYVVSGSNMSGKSTLLRTLGVNVVLAGAGCTVRCTSMELSLFSLASSLKISDSLMAGVSKFYAEVRRMRTLLSIAREGPHTLLFLIDEIFQGTNSHDRQEGAAALFVELVNLGALGLVTTHDLALTRPPETIVEAVRNVHFIDTYTDGELGFDYRLKPGVVGKSNALELMRSMGLHV